MKKFNFKGLVCIDSELSRLCMEQIARLPEMVGKERIDDILFGFWGEPLVTSYDYADKALDELGVFNCVNLVLAYSRNTFGKYKVDRLDAPQTVNTCVRIFGRCLLEKSATYKARKMQDYGKRPLQKIEAELQVYLESLTEDFSNVVFDEYGV